MNKEKYRQLCQETDSIPIYSKDWWLDIVCGESNWDVCIVEKGNQIIAAMPYVIKRKFGFILLSHPPLTQKLGPWFRDSYFNNNKRLSNEKIILTELESQLPKCHYFSQNWHYKNTNWLPMYWKGYSQTTRYTYQIKALSDLDAVWKCIENSTRRQIKKAKEKLDLKIDMAAPVDEFLDLNQKTFERQGMKLPYSPELVRKVYAACKERNACDVFVVSDQDGNRHAGIFVIHDEQTTYYIMGGADPTYRSSGAMSFCMWEAIQKAAERNNEFDFEGSMIEPIEQFFRKFGAEQVPYYNVNKVWSLPIRLALAIKK
ncbi:GNAT family N-acetyltransferase [Vibrio vulnificus]|uniref:GNAT family N-acetyltransferase n=1 Tax=Vibrio vulnificus TaxID=672 RepID=UPI0009B6DC24|nr:GNAT family N-acetyltransferase [Vibrio vulnificus]EGR7968621.1 GNAT family N-acetyltransferase [Vibrio vulnificus]EID4391642.1 GNAT family N-acetyltransferase [Vibrio vulnificus]EJQ9994157.1 GNAT family N-acetyltransferase [Vibrio vulnificus]EKA7352081.1 GNAT family N-acetyltransferase [Vibrio vulnificus]ELM6648971.1 GNAT family N-acetyltransferase [Vibrio vulnificus]